MRNRTPPVKMRVLVVGHSSPMNAIESNTFTRALEKLGQDLPRWGNLCRFSALGDSGVSIRRTPSPSTVLFQLVASPP
jgi:hypothetical protein